MSIKTKITFFLIALIIPLSIWMFISKKTEPESLVQSIKPPVKELDIPMDNYVFNNDSAVDIIRKSGTRVKIKPGTFVKQDGSFISGTVELKLREFHSASDILRSGIPMIINETKGEHLKSAGMIEMRAFNKGEELEIKKDQPIDVALAGYRPSDGYQLYYLKNDAEWSTPDTFKSGSNIRKLEMLKKISILPKKPQYNDSTSNKDFIFDLAGNFEEAPYLATLADRKWKLCKDYNNPDIIKAMRINWDNVGVRLANKEKMIYEMTFSKYLKKERGEDGVFQSIIIYATPFIDKNHKRKDRKLFDSQMKEYQASLIKIEEEKKRLEGEANILNSFEINKMGIYNIDRLLKCPELQITSVSFDFQDELNTRINKITLFAVYLDENSVVKYTPDTWKTVGISAGKRMKFFIFLPGQKVAVVENEAIQKQFEGNKKEMYFITKKYPEGDYLKLLNNDLAKN